MIVAPIPAGIFEIFTEFFNFISSIFELIWTLLNGVIQLIAIIPQAVVALTNALNALPEVTIGFAATTITVSIIFIILGREGGAEG